MSQVAAASVDLYWLPLGAGDNTHCVRTNGRIFEAVTARYERRARCDLYHAALEVGLGDDRFVIEQEIGVTGSGTPSRPLRAATVTGDAGPAAPPTPR